MPILGKLKATLIQNSNVCEDLSPRKLSHIFKNLLDVVKWKANNLLTVLLPNSCICFLSTFSLINCISGVFVLLSSHTFIALIKTGKKLDVAFSLVRPEAEGNGYFCEEFIIGW